MVYRVNMHHIMRASYEVEANNVEEAKVIAYQASFEDEDWEEVDTIYNSVVKLDEY